MGDLTLEEWLVSTIELRDLLLTYSKSSIPTDPGERQLDIAKALQAGQDAGDLLADCDKHLTDQTAKEILAVRKEYPELTADERRLTVKSRVSNIERLRDGFQVIYTSIKDRRFTLMSVGRW